ncbi:Tartrate transporter [Mycena kentingensis (nom. inval.)]|nr:Tartrate transporter [Mycena kentingensis (nom. inval.)]
MNSSENEKRRASDERIEVASSSKDEDKLDPLPDVGTPERVALERKLVRKLDMRLLPTIILIFIMNYIDRNGITTARLKGLEADLGLTGLQYSVVLSVLFASYVPFQIPSNMILNYISRPSWYISFCVVGWGLTSLLTGVTKNYGGIVACRIFIGLPESAFYPGGVSPLGFLCHTDSEMDISASALSALSLVHEEGTRLPWLDPIQWPAHLERFRLAHGGGHSIRDGRRTRGPSVEMGAITIAVGLFCLWALPDYPNNTRWISASERRLAQARLAEDAGEADKDDDNESPWTGLKLAATDPLVGTFAIMNIAQLLGLSFISFFPTLTATLGYNTTISLLLAAPPWIFSSLLCCLNAWHADRTGERFLHASGLWWMVILGFIIALATDHTGARYFAMFLMAGGYACFPMTGAWVSNSIPRPPAYVDVSSHPIETRRRDWNRERTGGPRESVRPVPPRPAPHPHITIAPTTHPSYGIGSYVWKSSWGPAYHQSMIISLCSLVFATILSFGIRQHLIRLNPWLAADERAGANEARVREAAVLEGISFQQAMERRKGFRYLY